MASKNMYSWWWDSHISPKNSKWLQENLTDMDSKVKIMIKLIEVDEDSFARRAEMYYKKRPELMKLVEEFYRAYRALAERYDHATGVIRQAHKTMAEVFPNQVPSLLTGDEGPMGSGNGDSGPRTPEMPPRARAAFDPDELWGDAPGFSPSDFQSVRRTGVPTRDSGFQAGRNGRLEERRARKGLTFHEVEDQERKPQNNGASDPGAQPLSDSERLGKSEMDIQALKEALARLEAEKEAGLLQYQQSLARLSKLELEISRAQEDSKGLNERASKAEAEVKGLKGTLARVESEKENNLLQYQRCLERISTLESCISHAQEGAGLLNERACRAEDEAAALKEELAQLKSEKEAELAKYMEALEKIANLGNRLSLADDEATRTSQQADEAEKEVKELKQVVVRLTEEKESLALKYQRCLEMIADLEHKLALAQGEVEMLRSKIEEGAEKLKGAEEQCLLLERSNRSVQLELGTLVQKVGLQNQEISEKQKELGRLWTSVQEERLRFVETETAFHVLQNLHSQTQEELRSLGAELQRRVQLLNELEVNNQHLKGEVQMVRDENKNLSDANVSSAVSIQTMQDEVSNLRQEKGDLEGELELRLDQRNALQQEIECLKEELNDLKKKHYGVMGQMESVGLNSECLDSSVRELQKENHRLRESRDKNEAEIGVLIEKLGVMEKLIDKNAHLEKTLSELSSDLEEAREKMRVVEESTQLLMGEKSTILDEKAALIYQLDKTTENLEKLSERNTFLENSLSDANAELEVLRLKTKNLEASCQALNDEKAALVDEKHTLASQLETACQKLEELGKRHAELEQKYSGLEQERDCTLLRLKEMQVSLENEKQAHATSAELSQKRLTDMENQIRALHKAGEQASFELEEELDKAVNAQLEIFILRKSVHDLKEKNSSLLLTCETLYEASKFSEKLISGLELENFDQQEEVRVLSDHIKRLRAGIVQLLKSLEIGGFIGFEDTHDYETALYHILSKVDDLKSSLSKAWDENQKLVMEKSVVLALFGSLKEEMGDLKSVVNSMRQDFRVGHDQLSSLQEDMQRLLESNEELLLCVREGHHKQEVFAAEMESLRGQLTDLQKAYHSLQEENRTIADEKRSLLKTVGHLGEEKYGLEKDNSLLISEVVRLDNLSLILKSSILEKCQEFIYVKIMLHQTEEKLLEANAVTCDQKKQIAALSEKYSQQYEDCMQLQKSIQNLDAEVGRMQKQHEETEVKVEALNLELQTGRDEVKLWETVAGTFFCELQTSRVREALFKGKLSELTREYHILEDSSYSKGMDNVKLRDQIGDLEGENFEMRARLAAYVPVITSLKNCVDSMENHASLHVTSDRADIHVTEDAENGPQLYEHDRAQQPDGLFELQDVHTRIQAVEKAVIDMKRHAEEEYLDVSSKLEAATRQIELLKSHGSSSRRGGSKSSRRFSQPEVTKDIMLDHVSDSSYGKGKGGKNSDIDDHTLELWETLEQSSSIDLKVGKTHKAVALSNGHSQVDALKEWKSRHHPSSSDPLVEKELGVDKLEMSKRFTDSSRSEENDKNKLLERLASDVQKLTNLQITVNDLKNKVESTEGSGRGKGVEYVNVKEKLDETEKSILKLLDVSGKLMKNSEDCSSSFNGSSTADSAEVGASGRKRKISDQARRVSEKIGRLHLEVQKLQFLLLKLDDNKAGKGGTRITNTRVLLRDYLYSGARTPRRRRKARLCGCVQPPTSGD